MKYALPVDIWIDFGDGVKLEDGEEHAARLANDVTQAINECSAPIDDRLGNQDEPWPVEISARIRQGAPTSVKPVIAETVAMREEPMHGDVAGDENIEVDDGEGLRGSLMIRFDITAADPEAFKRSRARITEQVRRAVQRRGGVVKRPSIGLAAESAPGTPYPHECSWPPETFQPPSSVNRRDDGKFEVQVRTGTSVHVMGASEAVALYRQLGDRIGDVR